MVFWLSVIAVVAVSATPVSVHDACTILHVKSYCQEDGFCFSLTRSPSDNTDNVIGSVSCVEAYISTSCDLIAPTDESPMVMPVSRAEWNQASTLHHHVVTSEGDLVWPLVDPPSQIFLELSVLVSQVHVKLENEFPYILAEPDLFSDLMTAADKLEETILYPLRQSPSIVSAYRSVFAHLSTVRGINGYLRNSVDHLVTLPHGPLREALFAHLVVFVHAWCRVYGALRIPRMATAFEFLE